MRRRTVLTLLASAPVGLSTAGCLGTEETGSDRTLTTTRGCPSADASAPDCGEEFERVNAYTDGDVRLGSGAGFELTVTPTTLSLGDCVTVRLTNRTDEKQMTGIEEKYDIHRRTDDGWQSVLFTKWRGTRTSASPSNRARGSSGGDGSRGAASQSRATNTSPANRSNREPTDSSTGASATVSTRWASSSRSRSETTETSASVPRYVTPPPRVSKVAYSSLSTTRRNCSTTSHTSSKLVYSGEGQRRTTFGGRKSTTTPRSFSASLTR